MTHHAARSVRALALLLCLATSAHAAHAAPGADATAPDDSDALYLKALESIAEGRRGDASHELDELVERHPQHAGALLDLALTHCSLGNADQAERLFAAFETRFSPSRPILELIANARDQGCAAWDASSSTVVTLGRGIDQNVNQGARTTRYVVDAPGGQVEYELAGDFRPRHDQYVQLSGDHVREITPNGSVGFAQYQLRRNDSLHQYDSASLFVGAETPWRFGPWRVRGTGTVGLVTLGNQLYQRQVQLQARATPPLKLPAGIGFDMVGSVTYNTFPSLSNFDSTTQEVRGHLAWRGVHGVASASLGYQNDHALERRPGGDRDGIFVNLLVRRELRQGLIAELGYTRQGWDSSQAYSPGLVDEVRDQTTQVVRGVLRWAVGKRQTLLLEGRIVRNRENISIFQYNNRQLQLSWQWQVP
jgi:hypothetical protein